jgi:alpha-1,2-glucosyltransferase
LSVLSAFSLSMFPLNYFFQYLYYTDTGSTMFFLIAYYYQLKSKNLLAALASALGILFRQTNVIWLGFCLFILILTMVEKYKKQIKRHSFAVELITKNLNDDFCSKLTFSSILRNLKQDLLSKKLLFKDLFNIIFNNFKHLRSYFIIILMFATFLVMNKGIVVGDRQNHQASLHLCQLFYFFSFTIFFSLSSYLFNFKWIRNVHTVIRKNFLVIFIVLSAFCTIVHNFTYEHPFLLADNRHYTFYIWSKIFKRHISIRYLLTTVYMLAIYLFYHQLNANGRSIGWILAYSLCLCASIVPQKLIEFRYFIIPFYIYRLNIKISSFKETIFELLFNCAINFVTIYIFLNKTFYWPNDTSPQRFMW